MDKDFEEIMKKLRELRDTYGTINCVILSLGTYDAVLDFMEEQQNLIKELIVTLDKKP